MVKYTPNEKGIYRTRVWDGTYVNGRKHYKAITSDKSSRDLERKVQEFKDSVKRREVVAKSDMLFIDYARHWLLVYKADSSLNTKRMYENVIEKHLNLNMPMYLLNRGCLTSAADPSKGQRTRQLIVLTLKQICKSAVRDKLISQLTYDDIFTDTIKPKYKSPEKRPLYPHEKEALFKADFSDMERNFVFILYYCGLRRGEAIALSDKDIDEYIRVDKAVYFDVNRPLIKDTKNGTHRLVPVPNGLKSSLKFDKGYLFHMDDGSLITKSSLDKMWRRIIKKMNDVSSEPITDLTPHIFRHNYCATLCGQIPTISINRIAELLGDSKQMVIEVYNHSIESKEQVNEVLNSIF